MCHFAPMSVLQLLARHETQLTPAARRALDDYMAGVLPAFEEPEHDFVGVNDNFPCMATTTAVIGGERYGMDRLRRIGERRLAQLTEMLERRGFASEFTSPTYTPVQLCALAELSELTADPAVRRLALQCEERLWTDVMVHYHPRLSNIAGPYSRAYTVDSAGHVHQAHFVLYAVLGDLLPIHPGNTLFADDLSPHQILHQNLAFMQVSAAWLLAADYHCPKLLIGHALHKPFPYRTSGTAEIGPSSDAPTDISPQAANGDHAPTEYPAVVTTSSTWMAEDYAIGVARHEFHSGNQTDSFHVLYSPKGRTVRSVEEVGAVFARFRIDGGLPDALGATYLVPDDGRKLGLLSGRTAMMLYKPRVAARGAIGSLGLSLLIPTGGSEIDEIRLGDRVLGDGEGESVEPCPVFIRHGQVYMAYLPLLQTNAGRRAAVRVERRTDYTAVTFLNYEGTPRVFSRGELLLTGNGFVATIGSEREDGDFEAFCRMAGSAVVEDRLTTSPHNRGTYTRRVRYECGGCRLYCAYSPASEGVMAISGDGGGREERRCLPLSADGLDIEALPFYTSKTII